MSAAVNVSAQQTPSPATAPAEDGSQLTVWVLTMGPGRLVYERFGHNAILIEDNRTNTGIAYNYGTFDFGEGSLDTAAFILHFIQGRMQYWLASADGAAVLEAYQRSDRSIWAQRLNLQPAQRAALRDFLAWNDRPENRYYSYDYYRNNCSTKVRDALDRVLNGRLKDQLSRTGAGGRTYRFETGRRTSYSAILYWAIDYMLGHPADQPLSAWDECFLPSELQHWLREVKVADADGRMVPLVSEETLLYQSRAHPDPPAQPPRWLGWFLAIGIALGAAMTLLGRYARRIRAARMAFIAIAFLWLALTGIAGAFLSIVCLFSDHWVVHHDENLLQLAPVALPLVALVPALALGRSWARPITIWLALSMPAIALAGLLLKAMPAFYQPNWSMIALALPAHAGLALAAFFLTRNWPARPKPAPVPAKQSQRRGRT